MEFETLREPNRPIVAYSLYVCLKKKNKINHGTNFPLP